MKTCAICGQPINDDDTSPSASDLIAWERKRQIDEEGYSLEHDDQHQNAELAKAAAQYAHPDPLMYVGVPRWVHKAGKSRIRQLIVAGALIVAEIERLQRLEHR